VQISEYEVVNELPNWPFLGPKTILTILRPVGSLFCILLGLGPPAVPIDLLKCLQSGTSRYLFHFFEEKKVLKTNFAAKGWGKENFTIFECLTMIYGDGKKTWAQFHQDFTSSFCAKILSPKITKPNRVIREKL